MGDEVPEKFLSGGFFECAWDSNVEGAGPGEGDKLVISSGTEDGTRQVHEGKVMGNTHGASYIIKLGGD